MGVLPGKKVLIFGGSGSLGRRMMHRNLEHCQIVNFSRDEWKHWQLDHEFGKGIVENVLGDIRDQEQVENAILRIRPDVVIIASALKHIERVEYATHESISTNLLGIRNILNCIEQKRHQVPNLQSVVFVSTDKACSPVNVYGMCKALSEKMVIEKAYYVPEVNFVICRYGNVLNSKGSIIPLLHNFWRSDRHQQYTLTQPDMTRFVMTLDESCQLIEDAISIGVSGDIVIPDLKSMRVQDLFEIFSELYNKPILIGSLRYGEKLHECLINETEGFMVARTKSYFSIRAPHVMKAGLEVNQEGIDRELLPLASSQNLLSKDELFEYLTNLSLLEVDTVLQQ